LYNDPNVLPRVHLVRHAVAVSTFEEVGTIIQDPLFIPDRSVILERHEIKDASEVAPFLSATTSAQRDTAVDGTAVIIDESHTRIHIQANTKEDSILILADTIYPGWGATVDKKSTKIFAANFSQRAIFVPTGNHNIQFFYNPASVTYGIWISMSGFTVLIVLVAFPAFSSLAHTSKKTRRNETHH
jgi:hypothetical protein